MFALDRPFFGPDMASLGHDQPFAGEFAKPEFDWYSGICQVIVESAERFDLSLLHDVRNVETPPQTRVHPDSHNLPQVFTVLVEQRSTGATEEVRESHYLRYLFLTELEELCAPCFQVLETRGWMTSSAPTPETWSVVAVLRRTP